MTGGWFWRAKVRPCSAAHREHSIRPSRHLSHAAASPDQVKTALQSAGNTNWSSADDGDSTKETLLNVAGL